MTPLALHVREIVERLQHVGPKSVAELVKPLREAVSPNVHVGRTDLTPEETVEWYAGQLLDIVDQRMWFAMNSLLNCVDKFVPAEGGPS